MGMGRGHPREAAEGTGGWHRASWHPAVPTYSPLGMGVGAVPGVSQSWSAAGSWVLGRAAPAFQLLWPQDDLCCARWLLHTPRGGGPSCLYSVWHLQTPHDSRRWRDELLQPSSAGPCGITPWSSARRRSCVSAFTFLSVTEISAAGKQVAKVSASSCLHMKVNASFRLLKMMQASLET